MSETIIQIQSIQAERMLVPIVGTSPLIVHKFSEKAKRQMLDAQQGKKAPKVARDPEGDYLSSMYRTPDGYGFPAVAFKSATVSAARLYAKSVKMTHLRASLFVKGELHPEFDAQQLVPIVGEPRMREDVVRLGISGTDLRYRAEFTEWSAVLDVTYVPAMLDQASILSLIQTGGMTIGVGEWRPERDGDFGTYQIDPAREVVPVR